MNENFLCAKFMNVNFYLCIKFMNGNILCIKSMNEFFLLCINFMNGYMLCIKFINRIFYLCINFLNTNLYSYINTLSRVLFEKRSVNNLRKNV